MAFKIRLATKQRRKNYHAYLRHMQEALSQQGGLMLQDANKQQPQPEEAKAGTKTMQIAFICPEAFEPAAFFVVAIDRQGRDFINTTPQPAVALRLATIGMDYASRQSIEHMQAAAQKSSIIVAPAGSVPTFRGPTGRG